MEDLHGRPVVAATPVSDADLRAMMNVFSLYHRCQVTLGLFPDSPMFDAAARVHDSRARISSSKRYLRTSSLLDAVCDASDQYRGFGHEVDSDETIDSRSKAYVALWERRHWLVESSVLMGMYPDFESARSPANVGTLFGL